MEATIKHNFFEILKDKMTKSPSRDIDQYILKKASDHFETQHRSIIPWRSIFVGTTLATLSLVLWLQISEPKISKAMMAESPEMLKEMDDIELLVEASQLNEEEWKIVMNGES